jgi:hypothetical protein
LASTALNAGFAARASVFNKTFNSTTKLMNIDSLVLDFFSAAGFTKTKKPTGRDLLEDLDELKAFYEKKVWCYDEKGNQLMVTDLPKVSEDCRDDNFYRSGLLGKTTYKIDAGLFVLREQLGRLVVRIKADDINSVLYGK